MNTEEKIFQQGMVAGLKIAYKIMENSVDDEIPLIMRGAINAMQLSLDTENIQYE